MRDNIIFLEWSIKRILAKAKFQTRRIVKPQPVDLDSLWPNDESHIEWWQVVDDPGYYCPYTDELYIKEAWAMIGSGAKLKISEMTTAYHDQVVYKAGTDKPIYYDWKSPLFMPRWASRLTLPIIQKRIERVRDITEQDAIAEGVEQNWVGDTPIPPEYQDEYLDYSVIKPGETDPGKFDTDPCFSAHESFGTLWDTLHAKPKRAKKNPYTGEPEDCFVSYPFINTRLEKQHQGRPWYVVGNPWVWVLEWGEIRVKGERPNV